MGAQSKATTASLGKITLAQVLTPKRLDALVVLAAKGVPTVPAIAGAVQSWINLSTVWAWSPEIMRRLPGSLARENFEFFISDARKHRAAKARACFCSMAQAALKPHRQGEEEYV